MKKLLGFAIISIFVSCSNDEDSSNETNFLLVQQTVEVSEQESVTTDYTYNGSKLVGTINSNGYYMDAFYDGDLISRFETYDSSGQLILRNKFDYNGNGQLVKCTQSGTFFSGSVISYTHNSDGSISYSQTTGPSQTLSNSGLITSDKITQQYTSGNVYMSIFTFDDKNHPTKNVKGYDKIYFANSGRTLNFNNNITSITSSGDVDEYITLTHTYNTAGYPITTVNSQVGKVTTYTYQ